LVVPDFATETYNRPNRQILRRVRGTLVKISAPCQSTPSREHFS